MGEIQNPGAIIYSHSKFWVCQSENSFLENQSRKLNSKTKQSLKADSCNPIRQVAHPPKIEQLKTQHFLENWERIWID